MVQGRVVPMELLKHVTINAAVAAALAALTGPVSSFVALALRSSSSIVTGALTAGLMSTAPLLSAEGKHVRNVVPGDFELCVTVA
jgi:hypothetical protein